MALIFMDGFDAYEQSGTFSSHLKRWKGASAGSPSVVTGRYSGKAMNMSGATSMSYIGLADGDTFFFCMGFKLNSVTGADRNFVELYDSGGVRHITLKMTTSNTIEAHRGASGLLGTSVAIPTSEWFFLEIKIVIHDSAGEVVIRKNSANILNLTSVDTRNGGVAGIERFRFGTITSFLDITIDDLVILDDSGTSNNTFIGNSRIDTFMPDADGTYSDFTPSSGVDHYSLVDETPVSESDYNSSNTQGDQETYSHASTSGLTGTIYGVQSSSHVKNPDAGTVEVTALVRSGGTPGDNLFGTSFAVGASGTYSVAIWDEEPEDATAWTTTSIDNAEFGLEITLTA